MTLSRKELTEKLLVFARKVAEQVTAYKNHGKVYKGSSVYVRRFCEHFKNEGGSITYGTNFEYFEREFWNWKEYNFHNDFSDRINEYSELIQDISSKYEVHEAQAEFWLSRFTEKLIQIILYDSSDSCLRNNVIIFTKDLEKDNLQWNVKAWINGINIEGEGKCIISEKVIIRKLQAKDFELEGISHEINSLSDDPIRDFPIAPTIIEFCDFEEKVSDISQYLELILDALKLYRCGSVFCSRIDMEPESFFNNKTISKSNFNSVALHQYSIKDDDFKDIIAFVEFLKNRNFNRNYSSLDRNIDYVTIAFRRYTDALLKPDIIESLIASLVACLESLYLEGAQPEQGLKLRQRVSLILGVIDFAPPLKAYKAIKRAYEIRSGFVHGGVIKSSKLKDAEQLKEHLLDYARVSILIFLQLKSSIPKTDLISMIDDALLDRESYFKLEEIVKNKCKSYFDSCPCEFFSSL